MDTVYITDYIDQPDFEREVLGDHLAQGPDENVAVLLVWHENIDGAYLDRFPNLKGVVRYGVGFDNLDLDEAARRGIVCCNTPDYGTEEVSDTAMCMILNIARGVTRYDHLCRCYTDGSWQENVLPGLRRTSSRTVGIIGAGRIGGSVLLKARAMRFNTIMYDPYVPRGHEKTLGASRADSLDEFLARADIVSIHTPLTDETRGMVDETFVAKMKPGASLVNTSRGKVVTDPNIFFAPLQKGDLDCLCLDVLPDEPPVSGKLIDAWMAREPWLDGRVVINPHSSYYSLEAYEEMRTKASANALRIIRGERPFNILNGIVE